MYSSAERRRSVKRADVSADVRTCAVERKIGTRLQHRPRRSPTGGTALDARATGGTPDDDVFMIAAFATTFVLDLHYCFSASTRDQMYKIIDNRSDGSSSGMKNSRSSCSSFDHSFTGNDSRMGGDRTGRGGGSGSSSISSNSSICGSSNSVKRGRIFLLSVILQFGC